MVKNSLLMKPGACVYPLVVELAAAEYVSGARTGGFSPLRSESGGLLQVTHLVSVAKQKGENLLVLTPLGAQSMPSAQFKRNPNPMTDAERSTPRAFFRNRRMCLPAFRLLPPGVVACSKARSAKPSRQ